VAPIRIRNRCPCKVRDRPCTSQSAEFQLTWKDFHASQLKQESGPARQTRHRYDVQCGQPADRGVARSLGLRLRRGRSSARREQPGQFVDDAAGTVIHAGDASGAGAGQRADVYPACARSGCLWRDRSTSEHCGRSAGGGGQRALCAQGHSQLGAGARRDLRRPGLLFTIGRRTPDTGDARVGAGAEQCGGNPCGGRRGWLFHWAGRPQHLAGALTR